MPAPALPISNPPNPWHSTHVEYLAEPPETPLQAFEERVTAILAQNDSPDVGFRWSLNPYRGCAHACAYCYARPSHQYLGFGAGTDFDRKIVVKTNAADALRRTFERRSWQGETIVFSGNVDCYQPLEASYRLTRSCLEVCREYQNPVSIITKGSLVRRDLDVLTALTRCAQARVHLSIPFADAETARLVEPGASAPSQRFETLRQLADAGIPCGISISPIIPGLNEEDIPELLERAKAAGARWAFCIVVRLPAQVLPVFEERMEAAFPLRYQKIRNAILEARGGKMNESAFGVRMRGSGVRWAATQQLFEGHCRRLGLQTGEHWQEPAPTFRRPRAQGELFAR